MKELMGLQVIFFMSIFLHLNRISTATVQNTTSNPVPVKVGVVLDLDTWTGTMGSSCIEMALSDFYASHSHYKTRINLYIRDSKNDVIGAAAAALDLIKNVQVQAILGPQSSMQADFVINLGSKAQVPIISFSATSPFLTSLRSPYFFRAAQNDSSQVKAISAIVKEFGWRQVVPIYVDNEFGEGIIPYLTDALQEANSRVPYRSIIPPSASDDQIGQELYKLMTMQTRVFVLHMLPSLASKLLIKAKEIGMMEKGFAWIVTNSISENLGSLDDSIIDAMEGVLGVKTHVRERAAVDKLGLKLRRKYNQNDTSFASAELNIFGLWAYDAAWALASAFGRVGPSNFGYSSNSSFSTNLTDLESFGVGQNVQGLLDALLSTRFKGLVGEFVLKNRQLESTDFQILNVVGKGERGVGFWTQEGGLSKVFYTKGISVNSTTSNASLRTIIWPGDTNEVPKGWENILFNNKKLRIGVPALSDGFIEFVSINYDNNTNKTTVAGGYSIDVFDAVVQALPYAVNYEYIPFAKPNGEMAGTYNDLAYQVFLGNYDAVVGDVTIISNRSLYVDFTLPYTESGVSMIVPITKDASKGLVFLKPLTTGLWLTSGAFFVFIGLVVWFLEHRINDDFRVAPLWYQITTGLGFSFSTMTFAQKEQVTGNLARIVVIVWCFVVLILTQSYTASLASLLTIQKFKPAITDVKQLIENGDRVGYQKASFVYNILKDYWKFDPSNLVPYTSRDQLLELLTNGSAKGGISAAIDEIPYLQVFLSKHCSQYTIHGPIYRTAGFGFVFPIGSSLLGDVSRAILNVTEGEIMEQINKKWIEEESNCASSFPTSGALGLDIFLDLFLISGGTAVVAVIVFVVIFGFKEKTRLKENVLSKPQLGEKLKELLKLYHEPDSTFHTDRAQGGELSVDVGHMSHVEVQTGSLDISIPESGAESEVFHDCSDDTSIGDSDGTSSELVTVDTN